MEPIISQQELTKSFMNGLLIALEMTWPYLLLFFVLGILYQIVCAKIRKAKQKKRKQQRDAEYKERVEYYLNRKKSFQKEESR